MSTPGHLALKAQFESFEFDLRTGELRKHGVRVRLQDQPARILALLLSRPGELVTRDEITRELWPTDVFVDYEHGLHRAINKLREALGDSASQSGFIETRARVGYRFIAPVTFPSATLVQTPASTCDREVGQVDSSDGMLGDRSNAGTPSTHTVADKAVRRLPLRRIVFIVTCAVFVVAGASYSVLRREQQAGDGEILFRQVTANSYENPVISGAISPNGKYLAYSDLTGIHIMLMDTGDTRDFVPPDGFEHERVEWHIGAWFPDSTRLIANLRRPNAHEPSTWMVSVLGGVPKELRKDAEVSSISRHGLIAFLTNFHAQGPHEIWVGNENREWKIFEMPQDKFLRAARFSPDGERLLYASSVAAEPRHAPWTGLTSGGATVTLEIRGLQGGPPLRILSESDIGDYLWLPDGRIIYAMTDRANADACNLWLIRLDVRNGKVNKPPRRLTNYANICVGEISAAEDGKKIAFVQRESRVQAYLADVATANKRISQPVPLAVEDNLPLAWTPDGSALIFQSYRNGRAVILRKDINSELLEPVVDNGQNAFAAKFSPDGAWLLYEAVPLDTLEGTPVELMRVPPRGGSSQAVLQARTGEFRCALAPVQSCELAERTPDRKQLVFTQFNPVEGRGRELARVETDPDADYDSAMSPDGARIVVRKEHEAALKILSLSGQQHTIMLQPWKSYDALDWSPDAKGLFTTAWEQRGAVLLYVDLRGNEYPLWQQRGALTAWAAPSRDGRHLAVAAYVQRNNVWTIEHF